jgi:hypothetical protein
VLQEAPGHDLGESAARSLAPLHVETEGNPFFVGEVLRHLVESGAVRRVDDRWIVPDAVDLDIPEGVRDVVGRRVSRLSPEAGTVLAVAAVLGRETSVDVLSQVAGLDDDVVCAALDEGVRARLLQETQADHYRFSHALVRTTLYEELSATRRRRLHLAAADALARLHPEDVIGLAQHLLQSAPQGAEVARAARAALAAGEDALGRRAPGDAATWFRHVLELLEGAPEDDRLRLTAALGLGRAQRDQGDPAFRETLLEVSRRARRAAGLVDLLVEAVLANQRGLRLDDRQRRRERLRCWSRRTRPSGRRPRRRGRGCSPCSPARWPSAATRASPPAGRRGRRAGAQVADEPDPGRRADAGLGPRTTPRLEGWTAARRGGRSARRSSAIRR